MADEIRGIFNRGAFRAKYSMGGTKPKVFRPRTWNNFVSELANFIAAGQITSFAGGTFRRGSSGTALAVSQGGSGGALAASVPPYTMKDASDIAGGKITITYGTHNGYAPLLYGSNLQPPIGMDAPVMELGVGYNTIYFQFDFTTDAAGNVAIVDGSLNYAGGVNGTPLSVFTPNAMAMDGSGSGTFYQTLGEVFVAVPTTSGGSYTTSIAYSISGSQVFSMCGLQIVSGAAT